MTGEMMRRRRQLYHNFHNIISLLTTIVACIMCISSVESVQWDISLDIQQNLTGAIGGEAFRTQPKVAIYDLKGIKKYTNLIGRVVASLEHPSMKEEFLGLEQNQGGECLVNSAFEISTPLVSGDATFSGLCVNSASQGYRIKFTLKDEYNITLGYVRGPEFNVVVGDPYQIGVVQSVEEAYGGAVWDMQSVVAVQDRGKNTVPSVNTGYVSIELGTNLKSETLMFAEESPSSVAWIDGLASFEDTFIKTAGTYHLNFTTDVDLPGGNQCLSKPITVHIGKPSELVVLEEPNKSAVYGGKAFDYQPRLHIIDIGGNIVTFDSTSNVVVSLYSNPSNGTLFPPERRVAIASGGVVQFRHLHIDKAGVGYRMMYELFTVEACTKTIMETNITTQGSFFDVEVGLPSHVKLLRLPSTKMWAGNQPFLRQPIVALVDAGGNIVESESNRTVDAILVTSLSQSSDIIIDTSNDSVPVVSSVQFHQSHIEEQRTMYSAGHNISIIVTFTQEVEVRIRQEADSSSPTLPSLSLNVVDDNLSRSKAELVTQNVQYPSRHLLFKYTVSRGAMKSELNVFSRNSFETNDYLIIDAWQRNATTYLPSLNSSNNLLSSKNVTVHSEPAIITRISTNVESGEYGAGHIIDFKVEFNNKVAVKNKPTIPLLVNSSVVVIDIAELGTSYSKSYFYIWYKDERSSSIPWNAPSQLVREAMEKMASVVGSVCVSRSTSSFNPHGYRWALRFNDHYDELNHQFYIETASVYRDHEASNISISRLITNKPLEDWTPEDGDQTMCTERHAIFVDGSGTDVLTFQYQVLPGDVTPKLNFTSLEPVIKVNNDTTRITNAINNGNLSDIDVNVNVTSSSLSFQKNISIDSSEPFVEKVVCGDNSSLTANYHTGDSIYLNLQFNKKIVVKGDAYILLNTGRVNNVATYYGGSGTNNITFKYLVAKNHWSLALSYDYQQHQVKIRDGYMRRLSHHPSTDANLDLPAPLVPLKQNNSLIQIDGRVPRILDIYVSNDQSNHFIEKDDILITVEFTSEVSFIKGPPVLAMSIGREYLEEALYFAGNKSSVLEFIYTVRVGDLSPPAQIQCRMLCVSSGCVEGVSTEGYIMQYSSNSILDVDLSLPFPKYAIQKFNLPIYSKQGAVTVNTTGAPQTKIVSITARHDSAVVSMGELIRLDVKFTDAVFVNGETPKLLLNTNSTAVYESGTTTSKLTFLFITSDGDVTEALDWSLPPNQRSPIICNSFGTRPCSIVNANNLDANLNVTDGHGQAIIGTIEPKIKIDSRVPSINSVYLHTDIPTFCLNPCNYTAGDQIIFFVKFDLPVKVLAPEPTIALNVVDSSSKDEKEIVAIYDESKSNDTDIAFKYVIMEGQRTLDEMLMLGCTGDVCSINALNSQMELVIRRKATFPTLDANITLPQEKKIGNMIQDAIYIDALSVPRVISVECQNGTGIYSPGDEIIIDIVFNEFVHVMGVPTLLLDVGLRKNSSAIYFEGSYTKRLSFKYIVESNHCVPHLDYLDSHSLETNPFGIYGNEISVIRRASANPSIIADTRIPIRGHEGSLSHHSSIKLDCRQPHVVNIWSPQNPGRYSTGDIISIMFHFSREIVVTGKPSILLETGRIDRQAQFVSQPNSTTLEFEYEVQLGDSNDNLDYWTDEGLLRSSLSSFQLNGGTIMLPANNPKVYADIYINPTFGYLGGQTKILLQEGIATYQGLKIGKRGLSYILRFNYFAYKENSTFETSALVSVDESSEYQVNGDDFDRESGDLFGASVSLKGNLLAVGAPNKRNPISEVQVLTVKSENKEPRHEIQLLSTHVESIEAVKQIQSFTTTSGVNSTISGNFSLSYFDSGNYLYAAPITVPSNIGSDQLGILLTDHFPNLGPIEVSRSKNIACSCENGWTWRLTFLDASAGIQLLETNGDNLSGDEPLISMSSFEKNTTMLGGQFKLRNPFNGAITRGISFDASEMDLKTSLEEDLGIFVKSVMVANIDDRDIPHLGRRWTITFWHHYGPYGKDINVPNLLVEESLLTGSKPLVWTQVELEGRGKLAGSFAMSFRGSVLSDYIPFNASPDQVEDALESLDSINNVTVSKRKDISQYTSQSGYSWTITFNSVNVLKSDGWITDPAGKSSKGNMPPLEVDSHLIGWNANYVIEYVFGSGKEDTQAQWMAKEMGQDGMKSGQVTVYHSSARQWNIESILKASDGDSMDHFGRSLSLYGSFISVGAPSKEVDGVYEQQTLTCVTQATNGTFAVKFRGYRSSPIPFDATVEQVKNAILGVYGTTIKVHTLPEISVEINEGWGDSSQRFCTSDGNSITVTLTTPDGAGISTAVNQTGDIESFVVDHSNLGVGVISVSETRKGTRILSGEVDKGGSISTLGKQAGSIYLFERTKECEFCAYNWNEIQKLTPLDGLDHPENSALFGWSNALGPGTTSNESTLLVGSPGFHNASGKVYTFLGRGGRWEYESSLTSTLFNDVASGSKFGHSVAIDENTVLIGSPGHNYNKGAVYVFLRHSGKMGFLASQSIYGPTELNSGDNFGYSLAISRHRAVICAPNHNDQVHSGTVHREGNNTYQRVGSCYVYERPSSFKPFALKQKLKPTNLSNRNRFGYSTAISGDRIIVGQLEEYLGTEMDLSHAVRGKAHLFGYKDGSWTESSFLFPHDHQKSDLFGTSVSLHNEVAVIGAPNRRLLDINSGSASVYDLSFSNFYFPMRNYSVKEGSSLAIPLSRSTSEENEIIGYKSLDRNADSFTQDYVSTLFQFQTLEDTSPIRTAVDLLYDNKAYGGNHYSGGVDDTGLWIDGTYDSNGRRDYQSIDDLQLFESGTVQQTVLLHTTGDDIYESPDEGTSIHISLPGMFASSVGSLKVDVVITDDNDGSIGNTTYYRKFLGNLTDNDFQFGSAIDSTDDAEMIVVGSERYSELTDSNKIENIGIAYVFTKSSDQWVQSAILAPAFDKKEPNSFFGGSVSVSRLYGSDDAIAIIGAPGQVRAHVFFYNSTKTKWIEESILQPFNAPHKHPEHNFAGKGSIDTRGDIAYIGSSGLETVYVYRRYVNKDGKTLWQPWTELRSNDYDFDKYNNGYKTHHMHRQLFGISVSSHGRLLLVGAPYADYDNRGNTSIRELYDTDGIHNRGIGRGKVYVFHSSPNVLKVRLRTNFAPSSGEFLFNVQNSLGDGGTLSDTISYNTKSSSMKKIIEKIPRIGEVTIHRQVFEQNQNSSHIIEWTLMFSTFIHDEIFITPLWGGNGCSDCDLILGENATIIDPSFEVETISKIGNFTQEWALQGDDVTSGDRFGYNIDLDGDEAIVGAMYSSSKTRTTWDFETGTLIGWSANGNAFDYQPVFGDNSKSRTVYQGFGRPQSYTSGYPQSVLLQGRYYIGTYEKRPGNATNYLAPDNTFSEGSIQGDSPTGTLTSDPFIILGDQISFLIGGGCDHLTEYIELLVDGFVTMRATGKCNERMERVEWEVSNYKLRAGQIRIVDAAQNHWGHINIDDITFSWKPIGRNSGCSNSGGILPKDNVGSKQHYSGQEESAISGAAYLFVRNCSNVDWTSAKLGIGCTWNQDQRLTPSDKRSGDLFGSSVSIDSSRGLAVVGSIHASVFDIYKQPINLYPHDEPTIGFPFDQKLEYLMKTGITLSPTGGNLRVANYISETSSTHSTFFAEKFNAKAGAIYTFKKIEGVKASDGSLLRVSFWNSFEHAKITPPDLSGNTVLGTNLKILGNTVFATAKGEKQCCGENSGGAAFMFHMSWSNVRFSKVEYEALEGRDDHVSIQVLRDASTINRTLTIGYSTSDLSAVGIEKEKADKCLMTSLADRNGCGDYEQTSGVIVFEFGDLSSDFKIRIIDDYCWERHMKYMQLNLHVPGGAIIQGEQYRAQVRIDDDDWLTRSTTQFCSNGFS